MSTTVIYSKSQLQHFKNYQIMEKVYLLPNNNFNQLEINGAGIFNSSFVSNETSLQDTKVFINENNVEDIQINMRGSICLFTKSSDDKSFFIIPDPLGSAILFFYDTPKLKVFSNSINDIKKVLDELNIKIEKNILYQFETIATGNGGLFHSPYKDIISLKPFQYIYLDKDNCFIKNNSMLNDIINQAPNFSQDYLLDKLIEDVEKNIKLVSEVENKGIKITHLTGGFDSRLIFSAIYKLGYKKEYKYFCSGRKGSVDKDISISLARHFGLIHTDYSGYRASKVTNDYKEKILESLDFTGGMLSNINPYYEKDDNIILSGGYGELLRSFYGNNVSMDDYNSYTSLITKLWPTLKIDDNNSIFTKEFTKIFENKFSEIMREANEMGIPDENSLDYYYQRIRNRYFVGQISFLNSEFNPRFDPLYSPIFSIALLYQPKKLRISNYFGIEMMKYFNRDLIQLPFDTPRINSDYVSLMGIIPKKEFISNYKFLHYKPMINNQPKIDKESLATKAHELRANKLQAWLWQVKEEDNAKRGLRNILVNINNQYLNIDYVNKITDKEITNRVDLRTLHLLYSNLLWVLEGKR